MKVGQARQNLLRCVRRLILGHGSILLEAPAQAPAVHELEKNVEVLPRLKGLQIEAKRRVCEGAGGGRTHLLLALVIRALTTNPFRDGAGAALERLSFYPARKKADRVVGAAYALGVRSCP